MERLIKIGDREVGFKATASTTKRYRQRFNRDMFKDVRSIHISEEGYSAEDLECLENMAYIMAWQYDNTIPADPDDWLDQFEMFDIYNALDEIIDLWGANEQELEQPKKKEEGQSVN